MPIPSLLRARLAARRRTASVSDATDAELDELLRRYEPIASADPGPRLSLDTGSEPAVTVERALARADAAWACSRPRDRMAS